MAIQMAFLRNILLSEPQYRQDLTEVRVSIERVGDPVARFIRLVNPSSSPAPRDDSLKIVVDQQLVTSDSSQEWISAIALGNAALPAIFLCRDGFRQDAPRRSVGSSPRKWT